MSQDKRQSPRVFNVVEVECYVIDEGATAVPARMSDLSVTGAFLDSMSGLRPGTRLALRFQAGSHPVSVSAEVVHTMPQFGMGVRFLNLSGDARAAIQALVGQG